METQKATQRQVAKAFRGMPTSDGAGVRLTRVIGQPALSELDPFLLLDHFESDESGDYIAGFPEHPHRGFETVTYMLAGRMRHRDSKGNSGLLTSGSVQWMTAGRGILHSEMPEQEEGLMSGFQLWVNLPAKNKMTEPRYQDIAPERIPETDVDGAHVRVIAGTFGNVHGPVQAEATDPTYLDVALQSNATFRTELPAKHNAFIYVFEGCATIGDRDVKRGELAVLTEGENVAVTTSSGARFLLVAGRPLNEAVARYGPVVMNTEEELHRAFADIRSGDFGS